MKPINMYINKSNHPRMIVGESYSIKQISIICNLSGGCLHNRFGFKEAFDDEDIRKSRSANVWPILETKSDRLSASWLNRRLI
jgi:hypothetical protein